MEAISADDEEMEGYGDDLLFAAMAGHASAAFRPRAPQFSCDCRDRLDELIALVKDLSAQVRELKHED